MTRERIQEIIDKTKRPVLAPKEILNATLQDNSIELLLEIKSDEGSWQNVWYLKKTENEDELYTDIRHAFVWIKDQWDAMKH